MGEDLASANVNRTYSLAATCIAIFTFMLFFLYPRYEGGEIDPRLFRGMLVVMGVATFSFVFATFHFYCASSGGRFDEVERARLMRRGDRLWLLGYLLLALGLVAWLRSRSSALEHVRGAFAAMTLMLAVQVALGILTVMQGAPWQLAILHQLGAVALFALVIRARFAALFPRAQRIARA